MPKFRVQTNSKMNKNVKKGSLTLLYALTSLPLLVIGFLTYINSMYNNPMSEHYLNYSKFTNVFTPKIALILFIIDCLVIIGIAFWKKDDAYPIYYDLSVLGLLLFFYAISHYFTAKPGLACLLILMALILFILMLCSNFNIDYTEKRNLLIIGGGLVILQFILKFLIPFSWLTLILSLALIAIVLFLAIKFYDIIEQEAEQDSFKACFNIWSQIIKSLH